MCKHYTNERITAIWLLTDGGNNNKSSDGNKNKSERKSHYKKSTK